VVGATNRTIAFPVVHVSSHRRLFIDQSFFEQTNPTVLLGRAAIQAFVHWFAWL
jgi:hypothetical protein